MATVQKALKSKKMSMQISQRRLWWRSETPYHAGYFQSFIRLLRCLLQEGWTSPYPHHPRFRKNVFADYDLILGPTAPSVAYDLDSLNHDPVAMYLADLLTIPVNLAGLPGISIPAGFSQGLPVGLQLIGPKYSEETIYQAAAAFEATTDYHKQQPVIFGGDN